MRRVHLHGHESIRKRLLIHTAGFNLGLLMRRLIGVGTPRGLQGRLVSALNALFALIWALWQPITRQWPSRRLTSGRERASIVRFDVARFGAPTMAFVARC
jgi:hypothetical protein